MKTNFEKLFVTRNIENHIVKSTSVTPYSCILGGEFDRQLTDTRFKHFVTFSRECFSENPQQKSLSIFTDPNADLPEWIAVPTDDTGKIEGAKTFYLNFVACVPKAEGSKIGGEPYFMRSAQANQLVPALRKNGLEFLLQLDEEDFFPTDTSDIDKDLRDILCGGVLYLFVPIKKQDNLIDFSQYQFDHQI